MLKVTGVKLDLVLDIDVYQFISGGVSYLALSYVKANNAYMKPYYKNEWSMHMIYIDENNLYGWAVNQYLLAGGFKWLTQDETWSEYDSKR